MEQKDTQQQKTSAAKPMSENYNETVSRWTSQIINQSLSNVEKEINNIPAERFTHIDQPFIVAEFGCSTGASSVGTLDVIIKTVRARSSQIPIIIYLNDLPDNHHALALQTVTDGLKPIPENVFIYLAGCDFLQQVFPAEYLDFAYSNMALQTLFSYPDETIECSYYLGRPEQQGTSKWFTAFEEHFERFMDKRKIELKEGGCFSVVNQAFVDETRPHHLREEAYYCGLLSALKEVITKHGISGDLVQKCIYPWCVMPAQAYRCSLPVQSTLSIVLDDPYKENPHVISAFQSGYWKFTVRDGLLEQGVDSETVDKIVTDFFDNKVHEYCHSSMDKYPQKYAGLNIIFQKRRA